MKFLADENFDRPIYQKLREMGYDVISIAEEFRSSPDEAVVEIANQEQRIILTFDKDFGDLVFKKNLPTAGVILVRIAGASSEIKAQIVAKFIQEHPQDIENAFVVIHEHFHKIRKL